VIVESFVATYEVVNLFAYLEVNHSVVVLDVKLEHPHARGRRRRDLEKVVGHRNAGGA
jgi:hypothetical protein